ncbi:hypothetical protein [Roseateles sp.]|uniref:hypothetical protein n=1 Tax=Roseateles sp. TaxID=1971397 RepID=UPI002F41477F
MAAKSVARIHKAHKTHPTTTLEMLNAIGEFVRSRSLRLCGSPFLSTYSGEALSEINYDISLDVEDDDRCDWTLRLREHLFDLDLLLDAVNVKFSGRSATYFSDRRLYGLLQLRPMPPALERIR